MSSLAMPLINVPFRVRQLSNPENFWIHVECFELDMSDCEPHHLLSEQEELISFLSSAPWGVSLTERMLVRSLADTTVHGRARRAFWNQVALQVFCAAA